MFLKKYYKSLFSLLLIFIFCFLPGKTADRVQFINIPNFDKFAHFGMFFLFSFFLSRDLKNNLSLQKKQILFIVISLSLIIGGSIEIIQHFLIPERSGDWYDVSADLAGSLSLVILFILIRKI